jgi:hypothetical protein
VKEFCIKLRKDSLMVFVVAVVAVKGYQIYPTTPLYLSSCYNQPKLA